MAEKKLLLGDEAIALGAIHAGISGVYAYPGTPSTEITEFIQNNPLAKERKLHRPSHQYAQSSVLSRFWSVLQRWRLLEAIQSKEEVH